jgi:formylglycine-generating enzyme required for sulfatase activity
MQKNLTNAVAATFTLACAVSAWGQVVIETVTVGHPGNLAEPSGSTVATYGNAHGSGEPRMCGAVDYVYEMGKYEITAAQYVAFLNAVATTDTLPNANSLYNTGMGGTTFTCNVFRTGTPGNYTYSVAPENANRPIGYISWGDAARFANWMHNGQPVGPQGPGTTEDGSYTLNGAQTNPEIQPVLRNPGATWVIPTEDEWYKAAYHKNLGRDGAYWDFATRFDGGGLGQGWPSSALVNPDPGNHACYNSNTLGSPVWRTVVGEFEHSASAYSTFDQSGNQWEWTESRYYVGTNLTQKRVLRGGAFNSGIDQLYSAYRDFDFTAAQVAQYGFRLAKMVSNDCNGNGTPDLQDLLNGTSPDLNFNDIPDECDIARGTSQDCNHNGIPDEAEVGAVTVPQYQWDDGTFVDQVGTTGGWMAWLNQFSVEPGRATISAISLSYGFQLGATPLNGTPVTVYLWSDPNGDGDPSDAVVLASAQTVVSHEWSDFMNVVPITPTNVGLIGTNFFVGAIINVEDEAYPANYDDSQAQSSIATQSWIYTDGNSIDPNALAAASSGGRLLTFGVSGNWMVRALAVNPVVLNDANHNGIPDDCEPRCGTADFNCDGDVGTDADIESFFACLSGTCPSAPCASTADFNGDGDVGTDADIEAFFRVLGGGTC